MLEFQPILDKLTKELIESFKSKGHSLNGSFESKVKHLVTQQTVDQIIIGGFYPDYGDYLNKGVAPSRIPYTPGTRSGAGKSKYIEGLQRYVQARMGISGKRGLGIAFAIATRQKQHGMSLRRTKRGSFFVDEFLRTAQRSLGHDMGLFLGNQMSIIIDRHRPMAA